MRVEIPEPLLPLLQPYRYKSIEGGRGSAKSHTVARLLLILGLTKPLRIACCREVQKSISASVKQLFDDLIEEYGLQGFYDSQKTIITSKLGGQITFHGLQSHRVDDVTLPWSHELVTNDPTLFADLRAHGGTGSIGCRIIVDGILKDERSVDLAGGYVSCLDKTA